MAGDPTLTVEHEPDRRRYLLRRGGEVVGRIDYRRDGEVLDLHHTEVDPAHEGRGYGSVLVGGALDDIRTRGGRVRPSCSFVAAYVRRHPADADLLERR